MTRRDAILATGFVLIVAALVFGPVVLWWLL